MPPDIRRFHGALLPRAEWTALGFHGRVLAGDAFTTAFHGFLTPTDGPASLNALAHAAQHRVLPGAVIGGPTAAVLLGIDLPWQTDGGISLLRPPPEERPPRSPMMLPRIPSVRAGASIREAAQLPRIHLYVEDGAAASARRGVLVHRALPGPVISTGGLVLSSVPEVLRQLATVLLPGDLVAAVDSAIGGSDDAPPTSRAEIEEHLVLSRGRTGVPRLRDALALARESVRSPGESLLRVLLVGAGFPEPDPNLPVYDPATGQRRYLDLAWGALKLALEFDGDWHRTGKEQWRRDEARRDELRSQGWDLARANGEDLLRPLRVLLRIGRAMRELGVRVPSEQQLREHVAALPRQRLSLAIAPTQPRA